MRCNRVMLLLLTGILLVAALFFMPRRTDNFIVENPTAIVEKDGKLAVVFKLKNSGGPDLLVDAHSNAASSVRILRPTPIETTAIPDGASVSFARDGVFLEVSGLKKTLGDGEMLPISLVFQNSGRVTFKARVTEDPDADTSIEQQLMAQICTVEQSGIAVADASENRDILSKLADMRPRELAIGVAARTDDTGWDINLSVRNFVFRRVEGMSPHVPGQGHGHIYLNGLRIGSLYSNHTTIGRLPPGTYTLSVSLNRNDHAPYMVDGKQVMSKTNLTVR